MINTPNSSARAQVIGLINAGQTRAAIKILAELLRVNPNDLEAALLLSQITNSLVNNDQNNELFAECLELGGVSPIFLYEIGSHYLALGKYTESINAFEKALTLNPESFEALHDMGAAYALLGKKSEAQGCFIKASSLNDQSADLLYNLGRLCDDLYDTDRAIYFYQKAVDVDPLFTEAWINLAIDLCAFKKYSEGLACFERAYALNHQIHFLYGDCVFTRMRLCEWNNIEKIKYKLTNDLEQDRNVIAPLPISALLDSPALNQQAAILFSRAKYPNNPALGPIQQPFKRKIRIGYFSPDFHEHPVSYLMAEVFELHDHTQFEVYAFSFGKQTDDPMRQRLNAAFSHFIEVTQNTPTEIARLSREMGIDIAIDLCGFTENARTEIFALRAAPIQISYIGFLGTMGATYMDYLIADSVIVPSPLRKFYSEKIIYLPCYQANDSKRTPGIKKYSKKDFDIAEDQFVFCNLNNVFKITESVFNIWLKILKNTERTVLLLFGENPDAIANLQSHSLKKGVDSNRLIFIKHLPRADYLACYEIVDLFLDTYPYNAGATASDALWMNVPIITLQGSSFPSRIASSLLTHLNLHECIHESVSSYQQHAIELWSHPKKLNELKERLIFNKENSPLFDTRLFVKNLEAAFMKAIALNKEHLEPEDIRL